MKKKMVSLALALAMCLGLFPLAASAAGTVKVVENEEYGLKITLNEFLRVETRHYNRDVWYDDEDPSKVVGATSEWTIYVVADNSTVTVEAMEGRKYADPALKDIGKWGPLPFEYDSPEYAVYQAFWDNQESYAYMAPYAYIWEPELKGFVYDYGGGLRPLVEAETITVSPATEDSYSWLDTSYGVYWMCESDYAKLVPATLQAADWAKAEVAQAYEAEIMPFSPYLEDATRGMTRDEFAAVTVRLYAAMTGKAGYWPDASEEHPFTDVEYGETTYYDREIGMAYNLGFVGGTSDTTFNPKGVLTRQEAAVMLARVYAKVYGDIPAVASTSFADDGDVASWAKSAVAFMVDKGVAGGVGGNAFAPTKTLSIQEAVIMANRMLEKLK